MNNKVAKNKPKDKRLKELMLKTYGIKVNETDLIEIRESMFHLGRAIYRYNLIKNTKNNS